MNICFVGIGSIALRHIRNLKEIYGNEVKITALRSGTGMSLDDPGLQMIDDTIYEYDQMTSDYDAIFITNPTSKHYDTLKRVINRSDSFFIEKPVFTTGHEDCSVFDKNGKVFYVACPLRYSNVIRYLKDNMESWTIHSIRCICSSYLPSWRSNVDYRNTYSAKRDLGGGVSLDLIHEWDYLTYLFGFPEVVKCFISKKSGLEIDTDDIAVYIAEYRDKLIELHLDYFGRHPERKIELFTDDDTIICDLINQRIIRHNDNCIIDLGGARDDYQKKELQHFIRIMNREINCDNDLSYALKTLRLSRGEI